MSRKDESETLNVVHPQPPFSSPKKSLVRFHQTKVHMVSEKSSRKPHAPRSPATLSSAQKDQVKMQLDKNEDPCQDTHTSTTDLTTSKYKLEAKRDITIGSDEDLAVAVLHGETTNNNLLHIDDCFVNTTSEEQVYLYRSSPKKLADRHAVALTVSG